ncbi:MAG: right-handed parallel beta-helix repeat-containing protein, partial [Anaerolineaceae bacterium]|nr:right-handed parallel beta-helix repeat-containing protein [Anaerolineaceae bacterium]
YGPVNLTIEYNEIYGNEKNGIYMGPKNGSITFTGNRIHDNGWDGIMLDLEGNYWNPTFEDPPVSEQYACYGCSNNVVASNNDIYDNGTAVNLNANYGVQVTGVYAGGSEQFSLSRERVKGFSAEIERRFQIPTYASIPDLAKDGDCLFLTSVDGRQHLEQFKQMALGKPVFIDKPFAVSTADAAAIIKLATANQRKAENGAPADISPLPAWM